MELIFVLHAPKRGENVGAAARALRALGVGTLRLVATTCHREPAARWLAVGAEDVLATAPCFATLDAALADVDLAIATTAKARAKRHYPVDPEALGALLATKGPSVRRAAVVFGPEDRGLSNAELARCDLLSTIPLAVPYPSLNLGQAVMLYAYALRGLGETKTAAPRETARPGAGELAVLRQRLLALSARAGDDRDGKRRRWLLDRLVWLEARDVRFLHELCRGLLRTGSPEALAPPARGLGCDLDGADDYDHDHDHDPADSAKE